MKIQGNKLINNGGIFSNPRDYFSSIDFSALSEEIIVYYGEVTGYPEIDVPGAIKFRIIGIQSDMPSDNIEERALIAVPLNNYIFTKPVPGQIVCILESPNTYYYLGTLQIDENENGNFTDELFSKTAVGLKNTPSSEEYRNISKGTSPPKKSNSNYDLKNFTLKKEIIPAIKELPGSTYIKGYYNNNIVLSGNKKGDPNILFILNREDNNYSCNSTGVFLQSNIDTDSETNYSCNIKDNLLTNEKEGSSLLINIDKIRINTKTKSIFVSSASTISFSCNGNYNIDTSKDVIINANEIELGKDAKEMLVLGNQLKDWLSQLIDAINTLTVGTANGPSSPPINSATFTKLKTQLNNILSKKNKTI